MPNHHDWERADYYHQENIDLRNELRTVREDAASVVYALDCALQLIDALILFLPEGQPLPENLAGCKHRLDQAMDVVRRRQ